MDFSLNLLNFWLLNQGHRLHVYCPGAKSRRRSRRRRSGRKRRRSYSKVQNITLKTWCVRPLVHNFETVFPTQSSTYERLHPKRSNTYPRMGQTWMCSKTSIMIKNYRVPKKKVGLVKYEFLSPKQAYCTLHNSLAHLNRIPGYV